MTLEEKLQVLKDLKASLESLKTQYLALVQTLQTLRTQIEQKAVEYENTLMASDLLQTNENK